MSIWGVEEHWETYDQIPGGQFYGDCDTFVVALRKELLLRGIKSRMVSVWVDTPFNGHLVLEVKGWILDNRSFHVRSWEDLDYMLISISGENPGDPWHSIDVNSK